MKIPMITIVGLLAATSVAAELPGPEEAKPRFEVALSYGHSWTDNPGLVNGFNQSDSLDEIGLDIPYQFRRPTYVWSVRYSPSYRRYRDFRDLDFLEHLLTTALVGEPSPRTQYEARLTYLLTQSQNVSPDFLDETTFLTNRTDRESLAANFALTREVAPRWRVKGRARARNLQIEAIDGFDSGVTPAQLGDQVSTAFGADAIYLKSEQTSINFGYELRRFDLELSDDETMHVLEVGATTQVSPETTISYGAGLVSRDSEGRPDDTEYEVNGRVVHRVKRGTLTARAGRRARNGDALAGPSTVNSLSLRYAEVLGRLTRWDAVADYAVREQPDSELDDLKLLRGSMSLTIRGTALDKGWIRHGLGLRLRGALVDQSGGDVNEIESSYYVVSVAVVAFFSN